MLALDKVRRAPGVYLLLDLDGKPAYAGQSANISKRLRDHLVDQRSDVMTDVLLDLFEVRGVLIWYHIEELSLPLRTDDDDSPEVMAKRKSLDVMEAALIDRFRPRWNRARNRRGQIDDCELTSENCDLRLAIVGESELEERRKPLRRIEAKLLHLLRAVRKASLSGEPRKAIWGLMQHASDLHDICKHGLKKGRAPSGRPIAGPLLALGDDSSEPHSPVG